MVRALIKLSRPLFLVLATLTYTLGAGIAHYLGRLVNTASFGMGWLAISAILTGAFLFNEYFRLSHIPLEQNETPRHRELFRVLLLQVGYAALTLATIAIMTLLVTKLLNLPTEILLLLITLSLIAYSVPPLRLSEAGYGELILGVILGTFIPATAFLLQYGQIQRLLSFTTLPLTLLGLAYLLACNFPTFATDLKLERHTLLTRLTWQKAIPVHHILVLVTFLLFATAPFLGYPWNLIWPVFLSMPFAIFQIIWLQNIAVGGRTYWIFLISVASATFGLTTYLLALTFWFR